MTMATTSSQQPTTITEESSESENETEPAKMFQRRVSTSKTLNGSVCKI